MADLSWLDSLTESQALDLVFYFERKFNWSVPSIWTRADADSMCAEMYGHDLTEEQWHRVCGSREWDRELSASTHDQAMMLSDVIRNAVTSTSTVNK